VAVVVVLKTELDESMRLFVERQESLFVATYGDDGERECTLRVGPPGFIRVLNVNRLAWPEYLEDTRNSSAPEAPSGRPGLTLGRVARNPEVSLLFVSYLGESVGLHVHGTAKILDDRAMRRAYRGLPQPVHGQRPEHWVTVYVEEIHIGD
jgi:uncharacterized protein